jgi:uncharacterized protein (DUF952 family)
MLADDDRFIYKICGAAEWRDATAAGVFHGSAVDLRDGFIHLSTAAQLAETVRRHFAGRPDLVIVAFDPHELGADLRWEPSRGGALFPHVHGVLSPALAHAVTPLAVGADGEAAPDSRSSLKG